MKFFACILAFACLIQASFSQFFPTQAIVYADDHRDPRGAPHNAVQLNAANDDLLPQDLLKSKRFYDNPRVAAGLAEASWFGDKEMPVHHREAEKIPRDRIYKLAKNAGFIARRR